MNRVTPTRLFSLALYAQALAVTLLALSGCSSGGDETAGAKTGGDFVVLRTEPADNGGLFLNEPIAIDFSNKVNLASVNLTTFNFKVFDQVGNNVAEPVAGTFELGTSPGDSESGRRLLFVPRLPTNDSFTDGGFRPGRTYVVQLVGGSTVNGTTLRDAGGRGLKTPVSFRFTTADGTTPGQLFRNTAAGGPRRAGFVITPAPEASGPDIARVVLNKLGAPPVEVRLIFDQPLNPSSTNVPVLIDTNPLVRNDSARGRVFLEYDDPDPEYGSNRWIPADVALEANATTGATVTLRPLGVLPNNATIRVIVEKTLEDISGESNVSNAAYERIFGTFRTKRAYEQQFDGLVEDFLDADQVDLAAPFAEPLAEVGPGYLKAGFAFEGTPTSVEYEPQPPTTVLNTNFTQVVPKQGTPFNVSGGVFNFKNVTIGANKTVKGQGSNPMVWLVSGTMRIDGTLSVTGGTAAFVNSSGNADVPKAGGFGACGGGDGGQGSPSTTVRDIAGATGRGPLQEAAKGGAGGNLACAGCARGSGGGGGALSTQGDPNFKQKMQAGNPLTIFSQQVGLGGPGCIGAAGTVTRVLAGGAPGAAVFVDARADNNFWGGGLDVRRSLRITGELAVPVGGGGGGGGGDLSYNSSCDVDDDNFENDSSGGGGGGGGGVLIVKALGPIIIGQGGKVSADGGHGAGGETAGSCNKAGGGGGGSGGLVVLMSATRIEITAAGPGALPTYKNNDYAFSVSADGGICKTTSDLGASFQPPVVNGKYPPVTAATYDSAPLGGLGGMGVVQLMAPPGTNTDGTNTVLDDNIRFVINGITQTGTAKKSLLAWRGFPNDQGTLVDDLGVPTNIGDDEGDIRPAPILLPVPFGSITRLRSQWLDTGLSVRRELPFTDDDQPRGIVTGTGDVSGPWYEFAGLDSATGYCTTTFLDGVMKVVYPTAVATTLVASAQANSSFLGQPCYLVELQQPALGTIADRFVQYEAELLDAADKVVGSFRILQHTSSVMRLSPEAGPLPPGIAKARVLAKFFRFQTSGVEGLGTSYLGVSGDRVPNANVRIGFAFHQDPADPSADRFPAAANTFAYDLSDPAVQDQIRLLHTPFVQWDVIFDTAFKSESGDVPPALGPTSPRPELHFLRLPFRF